MARFKAHRTVIRVAAVVLLIALNAGLVVSPALADDPPALDLDVSLIFDHDTYQAAATAGLMVVLSNRGTTELTGITARCRGLAGEPHLRGGAGWGPLAEGGAGFSVPAESTRAIRVAEPVPENAPKFGYLVAACQFGAAGYPAEQTVKAEATAHVPGVAGSGRGRIFQDLNWNSEVDAGEELAGANVVVTDPNTGAVVAQAVTDEHGSFTVNGVPAMMYSIRVVGPWEAQYLTDGFWYSLPVSAAEPITESSFAVKHGSEQDNNKPNLMVTAAFDKSTYDAGDSVLVRISVTNFSDVPAESVVAGWQTGDASLVFDNDLWGDFATGLRIEPWATRTVEIEGTIWKPDAGAVTFAAELLPSGGDMSTANNKVRIAAQVVVGRGSHTGILFGDRNNNDVNDPGEALGFVQIELHGTRSPVQLRQATDASGRFAFRDVPTGRYAAVYHIPGDWQVPDSEIVVDSEEGPDVLVRAVRPPPPLSEVLSATVAFTEDSYAVADTAHLAVSLTNRSSGMLAGITAFCPGLGDGNYITSDGPGWGALAENGPGVEISAGETAVFDVWGIVPAEAFYHGRLVVECVFGAADRSDGPTARDVAKVPGGIGTGGGLLIYDRNSDGLFDGDGVANTKVVLIDEATGKVAARAVTDANGRFAFTDIPADEYEFRVVGPWKLIGGQFFPIRSGETFDDLERMVVPGALQPDPDAPPESDPQPQGGVAPEPQGKRLAKTGVDVIELSIFGIAVLLAGAGLLFVRRRDTQQS